MKKNIIFCLLTGIILTVAGCGKKEQETATQINLSQPCVTFDNAAEGQAAKKKITEVFNGTVNLGGVSVVLGTKIQDQSNQEKLLEQYKDALEEFASGPVEIFCDDYEVKEAERTIEGITVNLTESPVPEISLADGTELQCNSIQELYEKFGRPDVVEELEGDSHYRRFGIIYRTDNKRVDYQVEINYDEQEEAYSYQKAVTEKITRISLMLE